MKRRRRNPGEALGLLTLLAVGAGGYLAASAGTLGPAAQHFVGGLGGPTGAQAAAVPGTGAPGTYNTVNGVKTVAQMFSELKAAGWGGVATDTAGIVAAYASTTKGAVTAN